jgi:hypothetical protein
MAYALLMMVTSVGFGFIGLLVSTAEDGSNAKNVDLISRSFYTLAACSLFMGVCITAVQVIHAIWTHF